MSNNLIVQYRQSTRQIRKKKGKEQKKLGKDFLKAVGFKMILVKQGET